MRWKSTTILVLTALGACAALFTAGGCAARKGDAGRNQPPRVEQIGESVYAFIPDGGGPKLKLRANEEFRTPYPDKENRAPEYPRPALDASAGRARVGLRIIIDPNGAVGEVTDSPVVENTGGRWLAVFREAAVAAVRQWRFLPAEFRTYVPGDDYDGDGKADFRRVKLRNLLTVYVDVRFDFDIVEGRGIVTGGFPAEPPS